MENGLQKSYQEVYNDFESQLKYFQWRQEKAKVFCSRFPDGIDFKNKTVLDLGCGHGALSIHAIKQGAKSVVGIDINGKLIKFAQHLLQTEHKEYSSKVSFFESDINDIDLKDFDIVVSHAVFEHIIDPKASLEGIRKRLKPQGQVYIGFCGLYNSPWGDHKRTRVPFNDIFPWAHICFSNEWVVKNYNKKFPNAPIKSIHDLGMNGWSYKKYIDLFNNSDLNIEYFKTNVSKSPIIHIINILSLVPGLKELFSINIYTILKKT